MMIMMMMMMMIIKQHHRLLYSCWFLHPSSHPHPSNHRLAVQLLVPLSTITNTPIQQHQPLSCCIGAGLFIHHHRHTHATTTPLEAPAARVYRFLEVRRGRRAAEPWSSGPAAGQSARAAPASSPAPPPPRPPSGSPPAPVAGHCTARGQRWPDPPTCVHAQVGTHWTLGHSDFGIQRSQQQQQQHY